MKIAAKINVLLALAIMEMGMVVAGCKSAPPLTQDQALAIIEAKYDATPGVGASIIVKNQWRRRDGQTVEPDHNLSRTSIGRTLR